MQASRRTARDLQRGLQALVSLWTVDNIPGVGGGRRSHRACLLHRRAREVRGGGGGPAVRHAGRLRPHACELWGAGSLPSTPWRAMADDDISKVRGMAATAIDAVAEESDIFCDVILTLLSGLHDSGGAIHNAVLSRRSRWHCPVSRARCQRRRQPHLWLSTGPPLRLPVLHAACCRQSHGDYHLDDCVVRGSPPRGGGKVLG